MLTTVTAQCGAMRLRAVPIVAALAFVCGCSGPLVTVAPVPPGEYWEAGPVTGEACGVVALGIFPVNVNNRAERAYERALEQAHATSLTDTAVTESWYFGPIGPEICTTVRGTALVRAASQPGRGGPHAEFHENRRSEASGATPE